MENKKKIAVIGLKGLPAFGGAARAGESIINILKYKYAFTVYAVSSHTNNSGYFNGYNQIVFKKILNKKWNTLFYYIKSTLHCLFIGNYDLVHIYHTSASFITPFLKFKYKVIISARGYTSPELLLESEKWNKIDRFFFLLIEKILTLFPADIIVAVSKVVKKYYDPRTCKKVFYIPNGVFVYENESFQNIVYNEYILFSAARIIPLKGCHIFLKALKKMNYRDNVIIVGDLNQTSKYEKQMKELAISLNVKFIELIRDKMILLSYVKNAKLFIFPSFHEGMSNMLLEAASVKTPIICSDIQENRYVFTNEEVLFVKVKDVNDLSAKITWALSNPKLMQQKAENAFKKIKQEHSWEKIAKEYDKLYQKLL
ncbi:MAG: glycosyltransferase family 4 protein [Bacteroidales bacterium]|nr:glycosyltransferase family 4 protein [Bacteroidales bacterium]